MKPKPFYLLLVVFIAVGTVSSQNEDELHIPVETDNQFPPDQLESDRLIEGSGEGVVEEPTTEITTESIIVPKLEKVEGTLLIDEEQVLSTESSTAELPCPKPCVCNTEGDTSNYIVDCSGYSLTEFPSPIDSRTTTLKLHNNKLREIPKSISELKNLKVLNANNNLIMGLASGSVSELPDLTILKLGNNRLIEYPKDLKNSISLSKLEELDLGGNDMRTELSSETFTNFKALRKVTLPTLTTSELVLDLCSNLKKTLETVCTESCEAKSFDCPDAPQDIEEDLLDATLPGMIPFNTATVKEKFPAETPENNKVDSITKAPASSNAIEPSSVSNENVPASEFSLRNVVNSAPEEKIAPQNIVHEAVTETATSQSEVKVGAKTADTKQGGGGVDKSVIGIVVAGMIVVVAGITIKKNWSSIKKRFSSTPRAAERPGGNANGTTPEEIPLQDKTDKSPV